MQKRLPKLGKPPLRVVGAKNNLSHLKPKSRPCTHYTGLKGYIQRTFIQILPTKIARRSSHGLHFSMGGHIIQTFGQVMSLSDNPVSRRYQGASGDFITFKRLRGFLTRFPPKLFTGARTHPHHPLKPMASPHIIPQHPRAGQTPAPPPPPPH